MRVRPGRIQLTLCFAIGVLGVNVRPIGSFAQTPRPELASIAVSPAAIRAGQDSTLTVTLTGPAPQGGIVVGISHITNFGVDDVIVQMPQSVTFQAGASSFPFVMHTRHRTDATTDIVFKAFRGSVEKATELTIAP